MLMGFPYCCLIFIENREFQLFGGTGAQVSSMCGWHWLHCGWNVWVFHFILPLIDKASGDGVIAPN
jgi:hypothetical protein